MYARVSCILSGAANRDSYNVAPCFMEARAYRPGSQSHTALPMLFKTPYLSLGLPSYCLSLLRILPPLYLHILHSTLAVYSYLSASALRSTVLLQVLPSSSLTSIWSSIVSQPVSLALYMSLDLLSEYILFHPYQSAKYCSSHCHLIRTRTSGRQPRPGRALPTWASANA